MTEIHCKIAGGVATIGIARPEARNSLTDDTADELYTAMQALAADDSVRVVVLRGEGADFCAGADIKTLNAIEGDVLQLPRDRKHFRLPPLLHDMPAITIAAVRGACAGAGMGWATACDLRFASTSAVFNTAFLAVAVAGDMGVSWSLPRIIGAGRARDLSFFPRKVLAPEALEIGLVTRVIDDSGFEDAVDALAHELAARAPLALRGLKANYRDAEAMDFRAFCAIETERHADLFATRDRSEAFAAFVQKRTAVFEGR